MRSVLALLLISPALAHAAVVDYGDYLRDTRTGIEWLDVTRTVGLSFSAVQSLVASGGSYNGFSFAGWSIARAEQLSGLVTTVVGEPVSDAYIREDGSLRALIHMLSPTYVSEVRGVDTIEYVAELRGLLDTTYVDPQDREFRRTGTFRYFSESLIASPADLLREVNWYQLADVYRSDDDQVITPTHGTFLVRAATFNAVPISPSLSLVLLACVAASWARLFAAPARRTDW